MLETILIVLAVLAAIVVAFVTVVAMQKADFRIARSATMSAPAADVFAQANDFHHWDAWSPWAKIDPTMKQSYEGAPAGNGAIYNWSGEGKVGQGLTLTESRPSELIRIKLEFMRPFKATNTSEFTFKPEGSQTEVTWSMSGRNGFVFKAFGISSFSQKVQKDRHPRCTVFRFLPGSSAGLVSAHVAARRLTPQSRSAARGLAAKKSFIPTRRRGMFRIADNASPISTPQRPSGSFR